MDNSEHSGDFWPFKEVLGIDIGQRLRTYLLFPTCIPCDTSIFLLLDLPICNAHFTVRSCFLPKIQIAANLNSYGFYFFSLHSITILEQMLLQFQPYSYQCLHEEPQNLDHFGYYCTLYFKIFLFLSFFNCFCIPYTTP